jgi:hypothetical protein
MKNDVRHIDTILTHITFDVQLERAAVDGLELDQHDSRTQIECEIVKFTNGNSS